MRLARIGLLLLAMALGEAQPAPVRSAAVAATACDPQIEHEQANEKATVTPALRVSRSFACSPVDYAVLHADPEARLSAQGMVLSRLHPEVDSPGRIRLLIIPQGFSSAHAARIQARIIIEAMTLSQPIDRYMDRFSVYFLDDGTAPSLGCVNPARGYPDCPADGILRAVADATSAAGFPIHEALVLFKAPDEYWSSGRAEVDRELAPGLHSYAMLSMPEAPEVPQALVAVHELGHSIFNLADEYLYPYTNGSVGNVHFNCRQDTSLWRGLPGDPRSAYEGCSSQRYKAYRTSETNIMHKVTSSDFGPLNTWWIDQFMKAPLFRYQAPPPGIFTNRPGVIESDSTLRLATLSLHMNLHIPEGTTQVKIEVRPFADDGPGLQLLVGDPAAIEGLRRDGLRIAGPGRSEGPYFLLPDMSYRLTMWVSNAAGALAWQAREWVEFSPWPGQTKALPPVALQVRTPHRTATRIRPVEPTPGVRLATLAPTLRWENDEDGVFYYEVQLSEDCSFLTDPATATAAVQWNLVHGASSSPPNSYKTSLLKPGTDYCWRVRPRIQGDGVPVLWSETFRFTTP